MRTRDKRERGAGTGRDNQEICVCAMYVCMSFVLACVRLSQIWTVQSEYQRRYDQEMHMLSPCSVRERVFVCSIYSNGVE